MRANGRAGRNVPRDIPRRSTQVPAALLAVLLSACGGGGSGGGQNAGPSTPPPPAPVPLRSSVHDLIANDIAWDATSSRLYIALGSTAPHYANSIAALDPLTGQILATVFAGSEPLRIAASDDGQYLYAGLIGATQIKRFRLPQLTLDLTIPVDTAPSAPAYPFELAVAPGAPQTVAVSLFDKTNYGRPVRLVVYDNAVLRTVIADERMSLNSIGWGSNAQTLYAYDNDRGLNGEYSLYSFLVGQDSAQTSTQTDTLPRIRRVRIHHAANRVYLDDGRVYDPAARMLLGTYGVTYESQTIPALRPDTGLRRVFAASRSNSALRLESFNLDTYTRIDTNLVHDIGGVPLRLLRWGQDGLACLMDSGKIVIAAGSFVSGQTSTTTPGAAQQPPTPPEPLSFTHQVSSLPVNDLAWDPHSQLLYLAVPSLAALNRNSITAFDPMTGAFTGSVFAGSEPGVLAVSDDGQYLYAGSFGSTYVRRFRLPQLSADLSIPLGMHVLANQSHNGPVFARQIAVAPGAPGTIGVVRLNPQNSDGLAGMSVHDDHLRRAGIPDYLVSGVHAMQWGPTPDTLYLGAHLALHRGRMTSDPMEMTLIGSPLAYNDEPFRLAAQTVYTPSGLAIDPQTAGILGTYAVGGAFAPDVENDRMFFAYLDPEGVTTVTAFDRTRFVPIASAQMPDVQGGAPWRMVRWGTDGLAFATTGGKLVVFSGTLVAPGGGAVPVGTVPGGGSINPPSTGITPVIVPVAGNDIAWDVLRGTLYMSVSDTASESANTICAVNLTTGAITAAIAVESTPSGLAISDDGQYLYAALAAAGKIQRYTLPQRTLDLTIPIDPVSESSIVVQVAPGAPRTIAVSRASANHLRYMDGVVVYDDAIARAPGILGYIPGERMAWGVDAGTLHTLESSSSGFTLRSFLMSDSGATPDGIESRVFSVAAPSLLHIGFSHHGGLLYGDTGAVFDTQTRQLAGTFPMSGWGPVDNAGWGPSVTSGAANRTYFAACNAPRNPTSVCNITLLAFDSMRYTPAAAAFVNGTDGLPVKLVQTGATSFAFITHAGQVALVQDAIFDN